MRGHGLLVLVTAVGCGGTKQSSAREPNRSDSRAATPTADPASREAPLGDRTSQRPIEAAATRRMTVTPLSSLRWEAVEDGDFGRELAELWRERSHEARMLVVPEGKRPAHVRTSSHHAIVVLGTMTSQPDGSRKAKPLGAASYWFQPAGQLTLTCTRGPCLVVTEFPEAFSFVPATASSKHARRTAGHRQLRPQELTWTRLVPDANELSPMKATLWSDSGGTGYLLKLPAGAPPFWRTHGGDYHAVVIQGGVRNYERVHPQAEPFEIGTHWTQPSGIEHATTCDAHTISKEYPYPTADPMLVVERKDCLVYVHALGHLDVEQGASRAP
jgi:hypothetical protein